MGNLCLVTKFSWFFLKNPNYKPLKNEKREIKQGILAEFQGNEENKTKVKSKNLINSKKRSKIQENLIEKASERKKLQERKDSIKEYSNELGKPPNQINSVKASRGFFGKKLKNIGLGTNSLEDLEKKKARRNKVQSEYGLETDDMTQIKNQKLIKKLEKQSKKLNETNTKVIRSLVQKSNDEYLDLPNEKLNELSKLRKIIAGKKKIGQNYNSELSNLQEKLGSKNITIKDLKI